MKRFTLSLFLSVFLIACFAQSEYKCFMYLEDYDVPKGYVNRMKNDVVGFWLKRKDYDKRLHKMMSRLEGNSKTAEKARRAVFLDNYETGKYMSRLPTLNDEYKEEIDSLGNIFQIRKINPSLRFFVIPSSELNAATFPDGTIVINAGLIDSLSFDELVAAVAHEMNHFVNKHRQQQVYAEIKKERSNKFWAGFGAAVTGIAAGVNAYYAGMAGQSQEDIVNQSDNYAKLIMGIYDVSGEATENFKFRYSREEEIESDIAAYRFLQVIGKDPNIMIDMIDKISRYEDVVTNKHDDHPSGAMRKKILLSIKDFEKKRYIWQ